MSALPTVPGYGLGVARNGMPEPAGYVYRGSGEDQLTPPGVMAAWNARVRERGASPRPTNKADNDRLRDVENELAAGAVIPQASARARPAPLPAPRQLADLDRELTARDVITPAAAPDRPVDYWPAYYPGPGVPGRCPGCGYLRTANGHKVTCGGEP